MFRQLIANEQLKNQQHPLSDLYFPNLNQLVKVENVCTQKNILFGPFVKINLRNQHIDVNLDVLQEFKDEKILFITRLQETEDNECFISISESPVHIDNGCNYFLLNAFWTPDKIHYLSSSKPFNGAHTFSDSKNQKKAKDPTQLSKEIFINLCYLLSSTIYVQAQNLTDLLLTIRQDNRYEYWHLNYLRVVQLLGTSKKDGRVSTTAADTKAYHFQTIENDIFEEEFSFFDKGKESRSGSATNRKLFTENNKNGIHTRPIDRQSKFFSRTSYLEVDQTNLNQKILQQTCLVNESSTQSYLMYESVEKLFSILTQSHKLMTLQQFHTMNSSILNDRMFRTILNNYQNSMQQQFNEIDQKSIDEIKSLLKQLFDKALIEFYEQLKSFSNPETQTQLRSRLLNSICEQEKILFENINKGKRESFSRRLSFFDNEHYLEKTVAEGETKFDALLGQRISFQQQIGFNLYRETIKDKINQIFADLAEENLKKTGFKSRKGKLMSRNEFSTNIDRRIDILLGQKRNLEQSLHYEEKLQENLMEYFHGKQSLPPKKEVETISEYSQDVE